jgi:hypothetical protein
VFLTSELEWGEGSAPRPGHTLPPGNNRYPLYRRLRDPHGRSGQARKISPPTGIRSPDRPARRQSLYRLSYPAAMFPDNTKFENIGSRRYVEILVYENWMVLGNVHLYINGPSVVCIVLVVTAERVFINFRIG